MVIALGKNIIHHNFFFGRKMMNVIYAIFIIAIKNLEMHLSNTNFFLGKNIICLELLAQKKKISK